MALPTLRINNSTGSDVAASGAGPATALTGAAASTDAAGLVVTLAGDLSGVLTDGSHVLWLQTPSGRQYAKIVGKAGVTVTVEDLSPAVPAGYTPSLSGLTWAIGGKRATLDHAGTRSLFVDARPGWTIEMEETGTFYYLFSPLAITASGGVAGPITLRGTGAVRPTINASAASMNLLEPAACAAWTLEHLRFLHTGTPPGDGLHAKTNLCLGWVLRDCLIEGCKIGIQGDFIVDYSFSVLMLEQCEIRNCTSHGISNAYGTLLEGCYIHDNAGDGWNSGAPADSLTRFHLGASYTIFARNNRNVSANNSTVLRSISLRHCVVDAAAGHGIDLGGAGQRIVTLVNSIIYGSGGWGVTADGPPLATINRANGAGDNTSGNWNNVPPGDGPEFSNEPFVDPAGHDYTPNDLTGGGLTLVSTGEPGVFGAGLAMTGYPDIGAVHVLPEAEIPEVYHSLFGEKILR